MIQISDIDAEEDENITHMAVVTQEPPPGVARVKIPAQSMNQRIFTILYSRASPASTPNPTLSTRGPTAPGSILWNNTPRSSSRYSPPTTPSTTTKERTKSTSKSSPARYSTTPTTSGMHPRAPTTNNKKIFSRNARHANGGSTGYLCPMSTGHSPSPFPFFLHPLLLIQAV
eukprot:scaffold5640_cov136-Isochrysis_galbana.AAC.1